MTANTESDRLMQIAQDQPAFGRLLGFKILVAEADHVEAEVLIEPKLGNRNGVMHGGAIMGLADNIGGTATFMNLKAGESTTTLESKTNFFRALPVGETARIICQPLHKGRRTMVWQTKVLRQDGKLAALVTQTQMILK